MATYTPNLNLKKPSTGEYYDVVADLNDAKDKIDLAVGNNTATLAQIPNQNYITSKAKQVDLAAANALIAQKANQTYVDAVIANIGSATPKGVFATLATLQSTYPAGATGVYVVTTDGKWYFWNNTTWIAGGTYQGTGIGDYTIGVNKTTFFRKSLNRNNKELAQTGYGFDVSGVVVAVAGSMLTDYIPVVPGEIIYQVGNTWTGYFYNSGKVKISAKNFGIASFTIPANCYFYRTTYAVGANLAVSSVNIYEDYGKVYITDDYLLKAIRGITSVSSAINKKWVVLGDSLTEVNATATKRYFDYINEETPLTIVNMGVGGTGYMRGYDTSKAFYQRISSIPADADFVTIFGSGNDIALFANIGNYNDTGTTTICGCVNKTLDNFFAICPATPIGIIAPAPWSYNPTTTPGNQMEQYVEKLRQIANYRGVPFLDLYHGSNLRPEVGASAVLTFDGAVPDGSTGAVHPNNLGHKIIYPKIREFIKTLV